jgi:hypothetical protein
MHSAPPPWALAIAAFGIPGMFAALAYLLTPPERLRYSLLVCFSVIAFIVGLMAGAAANAYIDHTFFDTYRPIIKAFAFSSIEDVFRVIPFVCWVSFVRQLHPREIIFGMVGSALLFTWLGNYMVLGEINGTFNDWFLTSFARELLFIPSDICTGYIVGLWTALAVSEGGAGGISRAFDAFVVAALADGAWNTGINIAYSKGDFEIFVWLPMLVSMVIKAAGITLGVRRLRRAGVDLRWPWVTT